MSWFYFSFVIILLLQMFLQKSILIQNSLLLIHSFICVTASTVVLNMKQWGFLVKCCIEVTLPHVFICFSVTAFSETADLCGMFRITVANGELKLLKSKVIKCCFFILWSWCLFLSLLAVKTAFSFHFSHLYCVATIRFECFRKSTFPHVFLFEIHHFVPNIYKNSQSRVEKSENTIQLYCFLMWLWVCETLRIWCVIKLFNFIK